MKVTVNLKEFPIYFSAKDESGHSIDIEGDSSAGGLDRGMRPMSLVLAALASCSAMDAVIMLRKQKQNVENFVIEAEGDRSEDKYPNPFEHIHLHYIITGNVADDKAKKAVLLAVEKYCSVAKMMESSVTIEYSYEVIPSPASAHTEH